MKLLLLVLIQFLSIETFGQKEVSNWYFGLTGLDFNCNPPKQISTSLNFGPIEGCSSISDSIGNLLFYTDGFNVFDKSHQQMLNGNNIGIDSSCFGSSTQGALIVKQPLQDSIYYIFTTDCAENYLANGFNYSIVNMNLNNGNGAVVTKKQPLLGKVCEKVAATRHSNGTDVWILTHEWGNNKFYGYLLTASGLQNSPVVSSTGRIQLPSDTTVNYPECAARGHMKFSPQGDKLLVLSVSDCHEFVSYPEIFSFDNYSGNVSYKYKINTQDSAKYYAGSFSPNGNLVYLSSGWYGFYIHQFNLISNDSTIISNSKYNALLDPFNLSTDNPGALQIGPNGKLYNTSRFYGLNIIHNPNNYGPSCNFELKAIELNTVCPIAFSQFGLPNNDESFYLNSFNGSTCDSIHIVDFSYQDSCINVPIQFTDNSYLYPDIINNWLWDFGDPVSGSANFSQLKDPLHTFSNYGIFPVKLIIYTDTLLFCKTDTIVKNININCVLNTNEINSNNIHLSVFPNPFTTEAILKTDFLLTDASLTLTTIFGQSVLRMENINGQNITIERKNISSGVYFLNLYQDYKLLTTKRIIVLD